MKKGKRKRKNRTSTVDKLPLRRHDTGAVYTALLDDPVADVLLKEIIQEMDAIETETGAKGYLYVKTPDGQEMKFESRNLNKQFGTSQQQADPPCTSQATQTVCSLLQAEGDHDLCALCGNPREGTGDNDMGPWIGCYKVNCSYWSHFRCQGFRATEEDVEEMKKDGDIIFYCPEHR